MTHMIARYFFAHDYSLTTAAFAAACTYSVMTGHYWTAGVMFAVGVVVGVAGELYLERRVA